MREEYPSASKWVNPRWLLDFAPHRSYVGAPMATIRDVVEALGKRAGVAINPATPAWVLEEILPDLDQVLVMTVNPGFGHQHFLQSTLPKIRRVAQMIERVKPDCELEVDGGIDETTAPVAVAAGANVLVAGTSVFGSDKGVTVAMESLRGAVTQVTQ